MGSMAKTKGTARWSDGHMIINKVHFHLFWKGLCSFRSDQQSRELIRLLIDYNSGVKAMLLINVVHHVGCLLEVMKQSNRPNIQYDIEFFSTVFLSILTRDRDRTVTIP